MPYLTATLRRKARVVTEAAMWGIKHRGGKEETALKLGRYKFDGGKKLESETPKSELTLDPEELKELLAFLRENLDPFQTGARRWIALDDDLGPEQVEQLKALFANPNKRKLVDFIIENDILPADLLKSIDYNRRCRAVEELEVMLEQDLTEDPWQKWFEDNDWVLGTEFVRIIDERPIDIEHIADYLMQAYDGFLDLVEIKRPEGALKFWADALDHGNYIPHSDLVKAITHPTMFPIAASRFRPEPPSELWYVGACTVKSPDPDPVAGAAMSSCGHPNIRAMTTPIPAGMPPARTICGITCVGGIGSPLTTESTSAQKKGAMDDARPRVHRRR